MNMMLSQSVEATNLSSVHWGKYHCDSSEHVALSLELKRIK